jgi:hypothetical protein
MPSLNEVQTNLDHAGIPAHLTPDDTNKIAAVVDKQTFARGAAEARRNDRARKWVITTLENAGVSLEDDDGPSGDNERPVSYPSPNAIAGGDDDPATPLRGDTPMDSTPPADEPPLPETSSDAPSSAGNARSSVRRDQHKVFGKKAGLTWEADETRQQVATVAVDAALAAGERNYDWANKIRLQLTSKELPMLAAVFLGIRNKFEAQSHGENSNKGMSVERQDQGFFVKVFQGQEGVRPVPVSAEDAFLVGCLLMRRLKAAHPGLDDTALCALMRHTLG